MINNNNNNTTRSWSDTMWVGVDVTTVGQQPQRDFDRTRVVYFMIGMILLWLVVLNLFVGVTIDKFVQLKVASAVLLFELVCCFFSRGFSWC